MFAEYLKMAIKNLRTRSLRSWLTILGTIIGVFLIITLISLSEGLKGVVMQQLSMMGKDLIVIFPGEVNNIMTTMAGGAELSEEDMRAIKKAEGVALVIPMVYKAEAIRYEGENKTVMISGMPWQEALPVLETDLGWSIKEGRWPEPGKKEIVVGSLVAEDIFPGLRPETMATINGRQFEITGILKSLGNKQDDSMAVMDLEVYQNLTGERKGIRSAIAKLMPGFSAEEVSQTIKAGLNETKKRRSGEDVSSFSVITSEKATGMVSSIMGTIQAVIFGFASIAIIVGGIGITNTMYTSVRERTKEIGVLKAVGAESSTIALIFLMEAGIIGLVGGIGGVIMGIGFAKLVEMIVRLSNISLVRASVSPFLVLFGLTFSFSVGCLSGFLPARKASQLKPVEALRYE